MRALFFRASNEVAATVRSSDDADVDWLAEPLRIGAPGAVPALLQVIGPPARGFAQLRDATCQSFPVWSLGGGTVAWFATASDADLEGVAERWLAHPDSGAMDADLYELGEQLDALRDASRQCGEEDTRVFVLLEETAL